MSLKRLSSCGNDVICEGRRGNRMLSGRGCKKCCDLLWAGERTACSGVALWQTDIAEEDVGGIVVQVLYLMLSISNNRHHCHADFPA